VDRRFYPGWTCNHIVIAAWRAKEPESGIMKTNILSLLFISLLAYFSLSSAAQAVVPPPDGGYPNFTTAEGDNALKHLTGGVGNTAIGTFSLFSVSTGNFNTALGAGSLDLNLGDSNTATGAAALLFNTIGTQNTAVGTAALESNNKGANNTASGAFALFNNTNGNDNTANGVKALLSNTSGYRNIATGSEALAANTIGGNNTAIGYFSLRNNISGQGNTAVGHAALNDNRADENTAVGTGALSNNFSGNHNIALGYGVGQNVTTANNVICIGTDGNDVSDSCFIGNIFDATSPNGTQVYVNSNGRLGTTTSSRRFKEKIKPMESASEALFALKPVTFRYKQEVDPEGTGLPQFGLVAEDVEKTNPDLIIRDKEGRPYSVRYEAINAMLLNEFLKEHRKVEQMQKQIDALTAGLQKVSAQLELSKPAPQTVLSNQ